MALIANVFPDARPAKQTNSVELDLGGTSYKISCDPKDHDRVVRLGDHIAEKIEALTQIQPTLSPGKLLLLACIDFADELDRSQESNNLESVFGDTAGKPDAMMQATQIYLAQVFDDLAARIESLKDKLD